MGPFIEITDKEMESMVQVDALQVIYTIKCLAKQLVDRHTKTGVKGAIVVTSSGLGAVPVSGLITYSSCKSFASFLAEGLSYELEGKVDVMSYQAGEVTTKMLKRYKTDSRTITPERAAKCCFRDLGYMAMTRGSFRHDMSMLWMEKLPLRWI